ncbi:MAG: response regulator [Bacteroidales bacterium]|nr:response regulator [Bacteroidales bacterium]
MQKIRTLLVEDEKISLITLKTLLLKHFEEIEVIDSAGTVSESIQKIREQNPDLVFLDISLPDGEGFDVLKDFREKTFETIFTTAHEQYALKAFDFFAIHYLIKPITHERLNDAIKRYHAVRKDEEDKEKMISGGTQDLSSLIQQGENHRLEFKSSLRWDYKENRANKKLEEVILKSIAAFNNAKGGVLFIGVDDDGHTLGLEKDYATLKKPDKDHFELHLRNLIHDNYSVAYASKFLNISFPVINDLEVCMIEIQKGDEPLYTTITDKNGTKVEKFFVRSGNTSQELVKPSRIMNYMKVRF